MAKKKIEWSVTTGDFLTARVPTGSYQLCISDPPYNFGQKYDAYADKLSREEYMEFTRAWIQKVVATLTSNGALWIFVPDEWVSEVDILCRGTFGLRKRNHVIWMYTFGQHQDRKFSRSHCHILYMTKQQKNFVFNRPDITVPSARELVYKDKRARAGGKTPDDTWILTRAAMAPVFQPDHDTWLESRVCGTFNSRVKVSPNQLPVPLLQRIVQACTNPGDRVLDPFAGTGSAGEASVTLGRSYVGYDLSAVAVRAAKERIRKCLVETKGR